MSGRPLLPKKRGQKSKNCIELNISKIQFYKCMLIFLTIGPIVKDVLKFTKKNETWDSIESFSSCLREVGLVLNYDVFFFVTGQLRSLNSDPQLRSSQPNPNPSLFRPSQPRALNNIIQNVQLKPPSETLILVLLIFGVKR